MEFVSVVISLVVLFSTQINGEVCKTCRGSLCLTDAPYIDCDNTPNLPFESKLMFNAVDDETMFACLDLEYFIENSNQLEYVQQCVLTSNVNSYCDTLGDILQVNSCKVEPAGLLREVRDADVVSDDEGSGSDSSTETTVTAIPDGSTTPNIGHIHIISIFSVLYLIIVHIVIN